MRHFSSALALGAVVLLVLCYCSVSVHADSSAGWTRVSHLLDSYFTVRTCAATRPRSLHALDYFAVPYHVETHERDDGSAFGLGGSLLCTGGFAARVSVGDSGVNFTVLMDTGSSDLLLPAVGAARKGQQALNSTTFRPAGCPADSTAAASWPVECDAIMCAEGRGCMFLDQYGDGSEARGSIGSDSFALGSLSTDHVWLGMETTVNGRMAQFAESDIDGIFGLAYANVSSWGTPSALDYLLNSSDVYRSFSMCLSPPNVSGKPSPVMAVGGNYSGAQPAWQWTPIAEQNYYTVNVTSMNLGSATATTSPVATIGGTNDYMWVVDSGTTLLVLPPPLLSNLKSSHALSWCAQYPTSYGCPSNQDGNTHSPFSHPAGCMQMSESDLLSMPSLQFVMPNMSSPVVVPPTAYMLAAPGFPDYRCLGIQTLDDVPIAILGGVVMQQYHVVFDLEQTRVGWGPLSLCPVATEPFPFALTCLSGLDTAKLARALGELLLILVSLCCLFCVLPIALVSWLCCCRTAQQRAQCCSCCSGRTREPSIQSLPGYQPLN